MSAYDRFETVEVSTDLLIIGGGMASCGGCSGDLICQDNGLCVENCERLTCEDLEVQCGSWSDGCGASLSCMGSSV